RATFEIAKDGTCLWRAAAHAAWGADSNQVADLIRHVSLETLRQNSALFRDDSESVDEYIAKHSGYKEWGGFIDLIAISLAMSVKFSVYQYNRQTRTVHLEAVHHESLAEKEVPVHYLLWENSHYDATYPLPPSTERNADRANCAGKVLTNANVEVVKKKLRELQTGTSGKQDRPFYSIMASVSN
ncbi:hypothetical protein B484DRAFT_407795, partial [Ochromonadaceae sp. CCMP2298]